MVFVFESLTLICCQWVLFVDAARPSSNWMSKWTQVKTNSPPWITIGLYCACMPQFGPSPLHSRLHNGFLVLAIELLPRSFHCCLSQLCSFPCHFTWHVPLAPSLPVTGIVTRARASLHNVLSSRHKN